MNCPTCSGEMTRGTVQVLKGWTEERTAPFRPGGSVRLEPETGRASVVLHGGSVSRAFICDDCDLACFAFDCP